MNIHTIISRIHAMPEASEALLTAQLSEVSYPKGTRLLEAGKVETTIYFLRKGIVRAYVPADGDEITFWFGSEGATVVSMKSYTGNGPGYESIELMEDSVFYELKKDALCRLFEQDIHLANWGRKFAENELIKAEERIISLLFRDASERYRELLENTPGLLQRIPLGTIASYLGITQVTLSRIRAKIK